jgi:long-chain acyl-CoA synthetase
MTEIGSVTFNDPSLPGFNPSSVGLPMEGVRIRIIDQDTRDVTRSLPPGSDGEIAISAPSMLAGYVQDPHRPCDSPPEMSGGFFLTGDQGHLDQFGRLTITGRLKLVIDIGGLKVNLLEVEALLRDHPDVQDCVVVPIPISETISRLKALVIPMAPDSPPSFDALRKHLRSKLSPYKVPRVFELRTTLPRSPGGKVLRYRLQ